MGKTLEVLATGEVPKKCIFNERFVAECCDDFHLHFRNLRIELSHENFLRLRQALRETDENYSRFGEPKSHHHLELGRALIDTCESSKRVSVELCENIYKKYPTGWDSFFHEENTFVHVHYRDVRLEMSNAEFLEFGGVIGKAYKRMEALRLKSLSEIFHLLDREGIIYVIIRNWENLPDRVEVGPHSDLDLLVHPDHAERLDQLLGAELTTSEPYRVQRRVGIIDSEGRESFIYVDVRQPNDRYFPEDLAYRMLNRRLRYKNFWIPNPEDCLLGLAYHILFHKGYVEKRYIEKIRWLSSHTRWQFFLRQGNDLTPFLKNVLIESGMQYCKPLDPSVRPVLPIIYPYESLVSFRYLWHYRDVPIFSAVYEVHGDNGEKEIVKQTTSSFASQEFKILSSLESKYFPKVWGYEEKEGYSFFHESYVPGPPLSEASQLISRWSFNQAMEFVRECIQMVETLERHGIEHRDLRADNIILSSEGPVLVDFGWASSKELPMDEPVGAGLGREARPPDGGPYDPYGLGVLIRTWIEPYFPEFHELSEVLISTRTYNPVRWDYIHSLLAGIVEDEFATDREKFIALCRRGRYREAEKLSVGFDENENESISFWRAYLSFILHDQPFPVLSRMPEDIARDEFVLNRMLKESLDKEEIGGYGNLLGLLIESLTLGERPVDLEIFSDLGRQFELLGAAVEPSTLQKLYFKNQRQEEWLNRWIQYIARQGNAARCSEWLKLADEIEKRLWPSSLVAIAIMSYQAGARERALYFAEKALSADPYLSEGARILAVCYEEMGDSERAIRWWNHCVALGSKDSRAIQSLFLLRQSRKIQGASVIDEREKVARITKIEELLKNIKQYLLLDDPEMALPYTRRLGELMPDNPEVKRLVERVELSARERAGKASLKHLIIPPLDERLYRVNEEVVRHQIEQLLPTNLGSHRIVKEKYEEIVKRWNSHASRNSKDQVSTLVRLDCRREDPQNTILFTESSSIPSRPPYHQGLVSIVMPVYNQLEFTEKCLESVFRHTRRPFELIIVDNGSTDGTRTYLEGIACRKIEIGGRRFQSDLRSKSTLIISYPVDAGGSSCVALKIVRNEVNLGFPAANNQGLNVAEGEYFLFMNNDIVVTEGWLDRLISCMESSPMTGIVGPMSNCVSGPQKVDTVGYDVLSLKGLESFAAEFSQRYSGQRQKVWRLVGFCLMVKRAVVEKIGGFDERFGIGHFEDDDFCLRSLLAGFESWIGKDCYVHHFGSQTFAGAKIDVNSNLEEKWGVFKRKWGIPMELAYGESYDGKHILKAGFIPVKHYCPYKEKDFKVSHGEELFRLGDLDGARIVFQKILSIDPENVEALNNLGVIAFSGCAIEKARSCFEKVLSKDPENAVALQNLGNVCIKEGRFEEAIGFLKKAFDANPRDVNLLNSIGYCLLKIGNLEGARTTFERSLQIDPNQNGLAEILPRLRPNSQDGFERRLCP